MNESIYLIHYKLPAKITNNVDRLRFITSHINNGELSSHARFAANLEDGSRAKSCLVVVYSSTKYHWAYMFQNSMFLLFIIFFLIFVICYMEILTLTSSIPRKFSWMRKGPFRESGKSTHQLLRVNEDKEQGRTTFWETDCQ